MFDSYVTLGPENIEYQDVLVGFVSFTVVAVGGATIGIVWGFLTGFTTRFTHTVRVVEPVYIFAMSYLAYVNAETFQMSGILSYVSPFPSEMIVAILPPPLTPPRFDFYIPYSYMVTYTLV